MLPATTAFICPTCLTVPITIPSQVPFSAYTFFKMHEFLTESGNESYSMLKRRALDEGFFGADFLMRMRAPSGSFFRSSIAPTPCRRWKVPAASGSSTNAAATSSVQWLLQLARRPSGMKITKSAWRSGGGLSIGRAGGAGRLYYPSAEYSQKDYIRTAKAAWHYLKENNARYTNDGKWNLVDEYCALMAVTELFRTTGEYEYLETAREMAARIAARTETTGEGMRRLYVDDGLPFYHAADEGMPVIALLQYAEIELSEASRAETVQLAEEIYAMEALPERCPGKSLRLPGGGGFL